MSTTEKTPVPRMSAEARRALVLAAATRAFARDGYAGTSTDAVAREAGVSQPYVVRIFGTKLALFLAAFGSATDQIRAAFREVLDDGDFDPDSDDDWERLGRAYTELLVDRDLLLVMMHGFTAGSVPEVGAQARRVMAEIFDDLLATGCTPERARDFVAHGMLLNVMLAMGAVEHPEDTSLAVMTECVFGDDLDAVVRSA